MPPTWEELWQGRHPQIALVVGDLRRVLRHGIHDCDTQHLTVLPTIFGRDGRHASMETVRREIIAMLMRSAPDRDCDRDLADLAVDTQVAITLFRAAHDMASWNQTDAREEAARLINPRRPVALTTIRRPGGREWKIIKALRDQLIDRFDLDATPDGDERTEADSAAGPEMAQGPQPTASASTNNGKGTTHAPLPAPERPYDHEGDFWTRASTKDFVETLARLRRVAFYAGADGPADVGQPFHRMVMVPMIIAALRADGLTRDLGTEEERSTAAGQAARALNAAASLSTQQLGSILHSLVERAAHEKGQPTAAALAEHVKAAVREERREASGFVSRDITGLALSLKSAGADVWVLSAHFDNDLWDSQQDVRKDPLTTKTVTEISYVDARRETLFASPADPHTVPFVALTEPMVVGEAELLTKGDVEGQRQLAEAIELLEATIQDRDVVFVGTSINDPGVLTAVARNRFVDNHRRYALLLPPPDFPLHPDAIWGEDGSAYDDIQPALRHALLVERYRHLGIRPVVADYQWEIPQLLFEATLRLSTGANEYRTFADRRNEWWEERAKRFGGDEGNEHSAAEHSFQERWHQQMRTIRSEVLAKLLGGRKSHELQVDFWVCRGDGRTLFRWASSEAYLSSEDRIAVQIASEETEPAAHAFRGGMETFHTTQPPTWSIPIVLSGPRWYRLPVGILKITNSEKITRSESAVPRRNNPLYLKRNSRAAVDIVDETVERLRELLLEKPEVT